MKFDTHLCLVSAQATPNLTPALDPDISPRRVVLAVSPDMQKRAEWLASVIKRHRVQVEILPVADAYDFSGCWETILDWAEKQQENVALNVTGGTKVMAMAAQDVFRELHRPVFYVNVENDQVLRIDQRETPVPLPSKIKLHEYLEAHGYATKKSAKPNILGNQRDFLGRLAYDGERLGRGLGRLNGLAQQAKNNLRSPMLDSNDLDSLALNELIGQFSAERLLQQKDGMLIFHDEASRQFVNGGWLEFLVYQSMAQLSPEIGLTDYATSVEITHPDGKTKNELDVACIYRNTLHVVECKSANLATSSDGRDKATEAIYKLTALKKLGGLRTKLLLVDYRGGLNDHDKARAAQEGVAILAARQLRNICGELKNWITNGTR